MQLINFFFHKISFLFNRIYKFFYKIQKILQEIVMGTDMKHHVFWYVVVVTSIYEKKMYFSFCVISD